MTTLVHDMLDPTWFSEGHETYYIVSGVDIRSFSWGQQMDLVAWMYVWMYGNAKSCPKYCTYWQRSEV